MTIRTLETDAEYRAAIPPSGSCGPTRRVGGLPGGTLAAVVSMLLGATVGLRADEASAVLAGD